MEKCEGDISNSYLLNVMEKLEGEFFREELFVDSDKFFRKTFSIGNLKSEIPTTNEASITNQNAVTDDIPISDKLPTSDQHSVLCVLPLNYVVALTNLTH
jgi:hypothetical protein